MAVAGMERVAEGLVALTVSDSVRDKCDGSDGCRQTCRLLGIEATK
jgi:hypothetical protein